MFKRLGLVVVGGAALLLFVLLPCSSAAAADATGTVHDVNGQPVAGAFVMLFDMGANVVGYASATAGDGSFTLLSPADNNPISDTTMNETDGFVTIQPSTTGHEGPAPDYLGIYQHQPRVYLKPKNTAINMVLPTASSFVLKGYKQDGSLMRWGDWQTMGPGANGGQFVYMTNLDEEEQPAMGWPTFDAWARADPQNGARDYGLPSLVVDSRNAGSYCVNVMYWYVKDYGKLCLKADNGGAGFQLPARGGSLVIDVNYELARTAIGDLSRRQSFYQTYITDEDIPALIAAVAAAPNVDDRLRDALQLRDRLELKAARNSIDAVRKGTLKVTARDVDGNPVKDCTVTIDQTAHDFLFGANGGTMADPPAPLWQKIEDAGFELAPSLPAWGFTESGPGDVPPETYWGHDAIDGVFGISRIVDAGIKVKFTGTVWMQGALGILPARTDSMTWEQIQAANIAHQDLLLNDFKNDPVIWEVMNEPATTNTVGMPRAEMAEMMNTSALHIKAANPNLNTLVNSPSEFDFGFRYQSYKLDGATPPNDNMDLNGYNTTYSDFLKQARTTLGNLDSIDTIGLQFYPGAHVSSTYGTGEAPAFTPSWLVDTADRYHTLFEKPVHITELSFPSSYDTGTWHSGYWRQPWDEATQADYAEDVYTMMFADPDVHSVLYWDTPDEGAFVESGGLVRSDLSEKPSYQRIKALLSSWTTSDEQGLTGGGGQATLSGFGGEYDVTVQAPDGKIVNTTARIDEREENELTVSGFNPVPTTTGLAPDHKTAGDPGFTLTVNGTNFEAGSKVHWNGAERPTTFASEAQITAAIPSTDITSVGTASVTVMNPGNLESNSHTFTIGTVPVPPKPKPPAHKPAPATTSSWYLAEGTSDYGFTTYVTIENANASDVTAQVVYMTRAGPKTRPDLKLPAMSQTVINPADGVGATDFSTKVTCKEGKPIAVDRRMTWVGPGSPSQEGHSSVGVTAPARTWYLAEGSSKWGFETWLLIQNPNVKDAWVTVTYMIEGQGPTPVSRQVPANSRASFNMATDIGPADASIKVVSDVPVIPERAMYRDNRREGHDSIGTTAPAKDYYLAEGTTDWGFTTYVLVQNPNASPTTVNITYMTPKGPVPQDPFTMDANSRKTINVNNLPGMSKTDCSIHVAGSAPIIAERAMYWGAGTPLGEACHDSIGMSSPHTCFYLPDGETGNGMETWTLVQNPNAKPVTVQVSYLTPDGKGNVTFSETVPANSRKSYNMADKIPSGRASVMVESKTSGSRIMVERAMYWNSRGAGTDTIGGYSD